MLSVNCSLLRAIPFYVERNSYWEFPNGVFLAGGILLIGKILVPSCAKLIRSRSSTPTCVVLTETVLVTIDVAVAFANFFRTDFTRD